MLQLADDLYGTVVHDTPILLDTNRARYFLLRGAPVDSVRALQRGCATAADREALARFGITQPDPHMVLAPPAVPRTDPLDLPATPVPFMLLWEVLCALVKARRAVRSARLPGALAMLRACRRGAARRRCRRHTESEIATAFARMRLLVASIDQCLARSLAIALTLGRNGHDATLIIGVQLPFAAHCWVQCGDRVIGDSLDRVRTFEPIFAL